MIQSAVWSFFATPAQGWAVQTKRSSILDNANVHRGLIFLLYLWFGCFAFRFKYYFHRCFSFISLFKLFFQADLRKQMFSRKQPSQRDQRVTPAGRIHSLILSSGRSLHSAILKNNNFRSVLMTLFWVVSAWLIFFLVWLMFIPLKKQAQRQVVFFTDHPWRLLSFRSLSEKVSL